MLVYLNGVHDVSTLGKFKISIPLPKAIKKIVDTGKKLVPPVIVKAIVKVEDKVKAEAQHLADQAKAQAKKIGAGIQRLASIPQSLAIKAFLHNVSQNKFTLATRIVETYKIDPNGLKAIASSNKIPWTDLRNAINKGAKSSISGSRFGNIPEQTTGTQSADDAPSGGSSSGPSASQYESWTKSGVGIVKQIIAWFKKHGKHKHDDDVIVDQMAAQVDADPTIAKYDEHGNLLPNADGSYPPKKSSSGKVVLALGAAAIAAKLLLAAS